MGQEKAIAIITARGGSKRIPRKNIKEFCGKPIVAYSIEAALQSGVFDTVMVSTDDEELAEYARTLGAEVPFMRSSENSNDYATTADVLKEVIDTYSKMGEVFDNACCIYPTAPFVTAEKLAHAMQLLNQTEAHTVIPVVQYSFPPQRAFVIQDDVIRSQYPEFLNVRSQDLEPIYHDCGQFYAFNVKHFLAAGKLIDKKVIPIIMSDLEVQDIDNEEDWNIAEMKYRLMYERKVDGIE